MSGTINQYILWLHVSVHDELAVQVVKYQYYLRSEEHRGCDIESLSGPEVSE